MALRLEGPGEAKMGEQLIYQLSYDLRDLKSTTIRIEWSSGGSYISSQRLSGGGAPEPELAAEVDGRATQLAWGVQEGRGVLAFTLVAPEDAVDNPFPVRAWVPGVCAPASNGVTTVVLSN